MATLMVRFEEATPAALAAMSEAALDALDFGVVGLDEEGIARLYNATESRLAGLDRGRVLGQPFFEVIAQCMNNYLVAQRFADEPQLDAIIPYVLTLRMRPTPVRLRMLADPAVATRFLLIER